MTKTTAPILKQAIDLRFLWLEITQKCNLTCTHCYADSSPQEDLYGKMTYEDWLAVIQQAGELGCRELQFIGGEPTMHPKLPEMIDFAKFMGFEFIEVFTNATRITKSLIDCFVRNEVRVATSFYSVDPFVHEQITQGPGSWYKTVEGIKAVLQAGLRLRVGVIESEVNKDHVKKALTFLSWLGVKDAGVDRERGVGRGGDLVRLGADEERFEELCGQCWKGKLCVTYEAIAYPCVFSRKTRIGNVKSGLSEILVGQTLTTFRRRMRDFQQTRVASESSHGHSDKQMATCSPSDNLCNPDRCIPGDDRCFPKSRTDFEEVGQTVAEAVNSCSPNLCNPDRCIPGDDRCFPKSRSDFEEVGQTVAEAVKSCSPNLCNPDRCIPGDDRCFPKSRSNYEQVGQNVAEAVNSCSPNLCNPDRCIPGDDRCFPKSHLDFSDVNEMIIDVVNNCSPDPCGPDSASGGQEVRGRNQIGRRLTKNSRSRNLRIFQKSITNDDAFFPRSFLHERTRNKSAISSLFFDYTHSCSPDECMPDRCSPDSKEKSCTPDSGEKSWDSNQSCVPACSPEVCIPDRCVPTDPACYPNTFCQPEATSFFGINTRSIDKDESHENHRERMT